MSYQRNNYGSNRGYQGGGNRQPRQNNGGRQNGDYPANSGNLRYNDKKTERKHPDLKGVMNVEIHGERVTFFISAWENEDGSLGLKFTDTQAQVGGYPQNGSRQNSPLIRGNSGQNGRSNGRGAYRQNGGNEGYVPDEPYQPRQNGAMQRARRIPEPQYYDSAPPPNDYPDGPSDPNDQIPF